ncbi:MAG: DoxX family protein [Flavobacteriales bacterium]|nr:DoxX family protein [Flavobacteriales bacterium]
MKRYLERASAYLAAAILLQTLYFKFTAHPDSVHLFSELGLEPWGRIGLGVVELIVAGFLIWKRTAFLGAVFAMDIMIGAVASHIFVLGIDMNGDGGTLFSLALVVFISAATVARLNFKGWELKNYLQP